MWKASMMDWRLSKMVHVVVKELGCLSKNSSRTYVLRNILMDCIFTVVTSLKRLEHQRSNGQYNNVDLINQCLRGSSTWEHVIILRRSNQLVKVPIHSLIVCLPRCLLMPSVCTSLPFRWDGWNREMCEVIWRWFTSSIFQKWISKLRYYMPERNCGRDQRSWIKCLYFMPNHPVLVTNCEFPAWNKIFRVF